MRSCPRSVTTSWCTSTYAGTCIRPEYARIHRSTNAKQYKLFNVTKPDGGLSDAADEAMMHYCDTVNGALQYCTSDRM